MTSHAATILYCSIHGTTRKVVSVARDHLTFPCAVHDATALDSDALAGDQPLIVFCPTYGDEELPPAMERLVVSGALPLAGRGYAICELGNYYGYENFDLGAMPILDAVFRHQGAVRVAPGLSLDSLPRIDWPRLEAWCRRVSEAVTAISGHRAAG